MTDQPKRLTAEELEHHLAAIAAYFIPRNDGFESTARVSAHIRALEQELAEARANTEAACSALDTVKKMECKVRDGYGQVAKERDEARAQAARLREALESVYSRIEHGDSEHRQWLRREVDQIIAEATGDLTWEPSEALKAKEGKS